MSQTKTTRLNALYERLKGANGEILGRKAYVSLQEILSDETLRECSGVVAENILMSMFAKSLDIITKI